MRLSPEKILEKAKGIVKPSQKEEAALLKTINLILKAANETAKALNISVKPEIQGSVAKGTWLPGDKDIDLFLLFPKTTPLEDLKETGLEIARLIVKKLGGTAVEKYAEHPYIEAVLSGYTVDIVPAYEVENCEDIKTAVDRTRLHTRYVNSKMDEEKRLHVRLLKKFMKNIGVYGAEIKIGGFSGYLCELLIINYGSFLDVLKAAVDWRPWKTIIDIERHYDRTDYSKLIKAFNSPLIVIDPVDKKRNAAAALKLEKMCLFMAAARAFLENPALDFFQASEPKPISRAEFVRKLKERESGLIGLKFIVEEQPPDVLWGQIYRTISNIIKLMKQYHYKVFSKAAWSDEKNTVIMLFELESLTLPTIEKHLGPPVGSSQEKRFLLKYIGNDNVLSGPFIENCRWVVLRRRQYKKVEELLLERILQAGLAKVFTEAVKKGNFEILTGESIYGACSSEKFLIFLRKFLEKNYHWLSKSAFQES